MKDTRKKIFLIICYLLVSVAMISTMSWARYKKDIDVKVVAPQAADFQASLQFSPDAEGSYILIDQMTEFKPGATAADNYALKTHGLKFTVDNAAISPQGAEKDTSERPIGYTLRIYGKGHMPLTLLVYDKTGSDKAGKEKVYSATRVKIDDGYMYLFDDPEKTGKEKEFSLVAGIYDYNDFVLYLGWLPPEGTEDYDDRKYMKEVERLEIRATVRALPTEQKFPATAPTIPIPTAPTPVMVVE